MCASTSHREELSAHDFRAREQQERVHASLILLSNWGKKNGIYFAPKTATQSVLIQIIGCFRCWTAPSSETGRSGRSQYMKKDHLCVLSTYDLDELHEYRIPSSITISVI